MTFTITTYPTKPNAHPNIYKGVKHCERKGKWLVFKNDSFESGL